MRIQISIVFSLLLIFSIVVFSSIENGHASQIIGIGTGFDNSSILELKNPRGNTEEINTVRIWLSGDNEFKTFKTEKGWMGKNTPQGVIIFSSQNNVNPGESVKFGIKTLRDNPTINWKALDSNGDVISSASTKILSSSEEQNNSELNQYV